MLMIFVLNSDFAFLFSKKSKITNDPKVRGPASRLGVLPRGEEVSKSLRRPGIAQCVPVSQWRPGIAKCVPVSLVFFFSLSCPVLSPVLSLSCLVLSCLWETKLGSKRVRKSEAKKGLVLGGLGGGVAAFVVG